MSRQRFIDRCIWASEQFWALPSSHARLLWIGILTTADDEGRRKATPESLKANIFPLEKVRLTTLADERNALAAAGLIRIYPDGEGKPILDIPKWGKYQTDKYRKPSAFSPAPSGDALEKVSEGFAKVEKVPENSDHTLCDVMLLDSKQPQPTATAQTAEPPRSPQVDESPKKARKTPSTTPGDVECPSELAGFPLFAGNLQLRKRFPELLGSWRLSFPALDIPGELGRAHVWAVGKKAQGKPYSQYVRYLNSWMMRQADRLAKTPNAGPPPQSQAARAERILAQQDAQEKKGRA